jgi:hypothetical protein
MTTRRYIGICAAAFLVSQVLAVAFFGFVMGSEYEPFRGTLLRSMEEPGWRALLLPVAHLAFASGFVWIYARIARPGAWVWQGLRFGLIAWLMSQVPQWLLWYSEQPWPGDLIAKQLALQLVTVLAVSLVVAAMYRPTPARAPDVWRSSSASV